jgi:hypothetical protein
MKSSWRDILPVHPAAYLFPLMSEAELRELGNDIKKNGLQIPIVVWISKEDAVHPRRHREPKRFSLLDGRNRLDAMELAGIKFKLEWRHKFGCWVLEMPINAALIDIAHGDPYEFVISANIHRRHLAGDQKLGLIAKVLKAKPEASNNSIAKQVKADDKTVAKVRRELEATSEIPKLEKTVGADGKVRKQPAKKMRRTIEHFRADIEAKQGVASKSPEGVSEIPTPSEKLTSELPKDPGSSQTPKKSHIAWLQRSDGTKAKFKVHPRGKEETDQIDRLARKLVQSDIETARELMVLLGYGDTYQIFCALDSAISEIEEEARLRTPASIETPPNDDGLDIPTYLRRAPKEPVP